MEEMEEHRWDLMLVTITGVIRFLPTIVFHLMMDILQVETQMLPIRENEVIIIIRK